jgi:hypothetical protein
MRFEAEIVYWRGPSPFFFAPIPSGLAETIRSVAKRVSYGWGMIPVAAKVGGVAFSTAMFARNDTYVLPLKADVRRRANITGGDIVTIEIVIQPAQR